MNVANIRALADWNIRPKPRPIADLVALTEKETAHAR